MNPGIPANESFEISDHLENKPGCVIAKINIALKEENTLKHYYISVNEGNIFLNEIVANYYDLTTISEKRIDLHSNTIIESYTNQGKNSVHFYNSKKHIDKDFQTSEKNIYSR